MAGHCHGPMHTAFQTPTLRAKSEGGLYGPRSSGSHSLHINCSNCDFDIQGHFSSKRGRARPPIQPQLESLQRWAGIYSTRSLHELLSRTRHKGQPYTPGDRRRMKHLIMPGTFICSTLQTVINPHARTGYICSTISQGFIIRHRH